MHNLQISDINPTLTNPYPKRDHDPDSNPDPKPNPNPRQIAQCILQIVQTHKFRATRIHCSTSVITFICLTQSQQLVAKVTRETCVYNVQCFTPVDD